MVSVQCCFQLLTMENLDMKIELTTRGSWGVLQSYYSIRNRYKITSFKLFPKSHQSIFFYSLWPAAGKFFFNYDDFGFGYFVPCQDDLFRGLHL